MVGCVVKIREMLPSFTKKEKQIADYVLNFPDEAVEMSIDELSSSCSTSPSCVVRFCKSLGFAGYKDFCRNLMADIKNDDERHITYEDIRPGDSLESVSRNVALCNIKAIQNTLQTLDLGQFQLAVDAISAAKRVDFFGVGISGLVALDAHNKFIRINKISNANQDPHVQILTAATLSRDDAAVFISYSGETNDILTILDVVKKTSATTIAITRCGKNPLCTGCDIQLSASSTETLIRSSAMSSRISQLTIIDMLYTAVASANYNEVKKYLDKTRYAAGRIRTNFSK